MITISPGKDFTEWREKARSLIAGNFRPQDILWEESSLFGGMETPLSSANGLKVPASFLDLAKTAACHNDPAKWPLLYRILWRITLGGERRLLEIASDPDISKISAMAKNVRREIHKMHAFVRFKLIDADDDGRERYAAWFEPDHFIIEAATPFFRNRFSNMDWSIFTPKGCAHWIDRKFSLSPGVPTDPTGDPDALEVAWSTYYRSIFNPARLKTKMMQTEMPKRYWKNLPETASIHELISLSRSRVDDMLASPARSPRPAPALPYLARLEEMSHRPVTDAVPSRPVPLDELRKLSETCRVCPLWQNATCTVFGEGPADARIMIVGEQPGDHEDIAGKPFVGPTGKLLDRALAEAGIDRSTTYVTNAVKHFKWTSRGKIRLHQKPDNTEIDACRPWLFAELQAIRPEVLVILGNTAGRSLLGPDFSINRQRGLVRTDQFARRVVSTFHPAYLLRQRNSKQTASAYVQWLADLRLATDSGITPTP